MITSGANVFSTHLKVQDHSRSQEILQAGQKILDNTGQFHFATMQLETEYIESPDADDIDIGRQSGSGVQEPQSHPPEHEEHGGQHA